MFWGWKKHSVVYVSIHAFFGSISAVSKCKCMPVLKSNVAENTENWWSREGAQLMSMQHT